MDSLFVCLVESFGTTKWVEVAIT